MGDLKIQTRETGRNFLTGKTPIIFLFKIYLISINTQKKNYFIKVFDPKLARSEHQELLSRGKRLIKKSQKAAQVKQNRTG